MTTATFTNGKTYTIKNSKMAYTHAWQVVITDKFGTYHYHGFSKSAELAAKGAASQIAFSKKNSKIAATFETEIVMVR
jgi:hypothetical protein